MDSGSWSPCAPSMPVTTASIFMWNAGLPTTILPATSSPASKASSSPAHSTIRRTYWTVYSNTRPNCSLATHDGLGRLFRHHLWAVLAPRLSVQSSLGRTRRHPILANRSQSKLWCAERAGASSSQNRSDSAALGRLSSGRGFAQDGNRPSFGFDPESATRWPSVHAGSRDRGIRPAPQDLSSLNFIADPNYRRHILNQLNRGEGRGRISRKVFHGQRGELRQRYREGQEDQLGALGLVVNVIVLWNTIYMDAAIEQLRSEGYPLKPEDVGRLSPLMFEHINFLGRYAFALPDSVAQGQLRPLRSAEESDNE